MQLVPATMCRHTSFIYLIQLFRFKIGKEAQNKKKSSETWHNVYKSGTTAMDEQNDSLHYP